MPAHSRRQAGLSLVELMVAMTLGLFLILGVTQMYLDGSTRTRYFAGQSENLDNARYLQQVLDARLSRAGYRRQPSARMSIAFPAQSKNGCSFAAGQALVRVDANTLCLRYQPRDAADTDCTGASLASVPGLTTPYATFSPSNDVVEKIGLASGQLSCNGSVLADNVAAVHFDYGVDTGTDENARQVAKYVASPGSAQTVRSLRYTLLLASSGSNLTGGMSTTTCANWTTLSGGSACTDGDGTLRRIVSGSSMLRNLMP